MLNCFVSQKNEGAVPVSVVAQKDVSKWLAAQSDFVQAWLAGTQFLGEAGNVRLIPDASTGKLSRVVCCVSDLSNFWGVGGLPFAIPEGVYFIDQNDVNLESCAIAWGLGSYVFSRYKKPLRKPATLYVAQDIAPHVNNMVQSIYLVRDMVNTPTEDMGPSEFAVQAEKLAMEYHAKFSCIAGDELLDQNYPAIYTVGRASDDEPRLVDLRWGNESHPKVTLVGKGVCFDTGGLDIKPSAYMLLMKKDMAGGAHVLGLARMIMEAKLPVRLRVLVPAVENAISGNAYRPGDVIKSRKGMTIEIGNTDAEGRVVLADALTEAVSEKPDLLIDMSTLTGAARVALGAELPAVFSNNDALVADVIKSGEKHADLMWRLPLFAMYREYLNSSIADINNNSSESYGGAITAALFLKEFVPDDVPWMHFDMMAYNTKAKPGRPVGGEAMTLRAVFGYLRDKYS